MPKVIKIDSLSVVGEDREELEPTYIASRWVQNGTAKWKQYVSFF